MRVTFLFMIALLFFSTPQAQAFTGLFGGSMETATSKDGAIALDTAALGKGQSKHYTYTEGKTTIRFFLVRDNQGVLRAALDACEQCWREDKGYKLQDGAMLCVNCGMKFALNRIGLVRGGCNPHPIAFTLTNDTFSVTTQELLAGAHYFPRNK